MIKTWSTPANAEKKEIIPCPCCNGVNFKPALDCGEFQYVCCKRCGLVQINPQPVKDEVIARYRSRFGNDYLAYEIENEASFFKLQQLALKDIKFYEYEKKLFLKAKPLNLSLPNIWPSILDIGCATGALPASLRDRGWRVTGVEISPCAGYARNEKKLDVRSLPLEENNFPSASFDAILASHLIEHLNDPRSFLLEARRILKNEGRIFITTPNIDGFQARFFKDGWRSAIFDHLFLFSKRTLKKLLKNTGFKVEKISTWGGLAAGTAPSWLKKTVDFLAKHTGCGDVMIVKACL